MPLASGTRLGPFEREAQAIAALSHPNILAIHDVGASNGIAYAVMELLEATTLRERLQHGPLPVRRAIDCRQGMRCCLRCRRRRSWRSPLIRVTSVDPALRTPHSARRTPHAATSSVAHEWRTTCTTLVNMAKQQQPQKQQVRPQQQSKPQQQSAPLQNRINQPQSFTREDLINALNEDLSREYQAIIAYVVYSQVIKGAQYMNIADELAKHAKEELEHALKVSYHIDYLGGEPTVTPKPVKTSDKAEDMLRFDLDNENQTVKNYRERVRQAESLGEYGIAEDLREILRDEQEHQNDLATALGIDVPDVSKL